jgi:hypothetical protein
LAAGHHQDLRQPPVVAFTSSHGHLDSDRPSSIQLTAIGNSAPVLFQFHPRRGPITPKDRFVRVQRDGLGEQLDGEVIVLLGCRMGDRDINGVVGGVVVVVFE